MIFAIGGGCGVCVCVCVCVCVHARASVCVCVCVCTRARVCFSVHTCIVIRTWRLTICSTLTECDRRGYSYHSSCRNCRCSGAYCCPPPSPLRTTTTAGGVKRLTSEQRAVGSGFPSSHIPTSPTQFLRCKSGPTSPLAKWRQRRYICLRIKIVEYFHLPGQTDL